MAVILDDRTLFCYEGEWKDDLMWGKGKMYESGFLVYDGEW
jgi:hypothetical protein